MRRLLRVRVTKGALSPRAASGGLKSSQSMANGESAMAELGQQDDDYQGRSVPLGDEGGGNAVDASVLRAMLREELSSAIHSAVARLAASNVPFAEGKVAADTAATQQQSFSLSRPARRVVAARGRQGSTPTAHQNDVQADNSIQAPKREDGPFNQQTSSAAASVPRWSIARQASRPLSSRNLVGQSGARDGSFRTSRQSGGDDFGSGTISCGIDGSGTISNGLDSAATGSGVVSSQLVYDAGSSRQRPSTRAAQTRS